MPLPRVVLLLIAWVFLLSGCVLFNQPFGEDSSLKEALQGHISLWSELPLGVSANQGKTIEALTRQRLNEFMTLNPGVQISIKFIPAETAINSFIRQSQRGTGPNILHLAFTYRINELIESKSIQALHQDRIDLSALRPEALRQVRLDGKLYGIPTNLQTQVLCYNQAKVEGSQLPNSLPELISQAREGYSVGIHSGFAEAFWGTGIFKRSISPLSLTSHQQIGESWAQWLQWLQQAGNEPNLYLLESAEELQTLFINQKLAYITCWSSWIPSLRERLGSEQLGVALLPHATDRPATPPLVVEGLFFNQASSRQQMEIALELAQFITNFEQQKKTQLSVPTSIPVNQFVQVNPKLYPFQAVLYKQSQSGVVLGLANSKRFGQHLDTLTLMYQQVMAGQLSPQQAGTALTNILNQLTAPTSSSPE